MKKVVLKLELHDDKRKQKAMKTVSGLSGMDSIQVDMKEKKLTMTGEMDPVTVVNKLRKLCYTEIFTVGPAKEPEKKKEEPKKAEEKKKDPKEELMKQQQLYYYPHPPVQPYYDNYRSSEEDPNSCVIC